MRCECGSGWFVEERVIRLATKHFDPRRPAMPAEVRYRLRCVACDGINGRRGRKRTRPVEERGIA